MKKAMSLWLPLVMPWLLLQGCGGGGGTATGTGQPGGSGTTGQTITRTIAGTVVNGSGSPVSGATVTVAATRASGRAESTTTGANGQFTLIVTVLTSVREIVLQISHPTAGTTQVTVEVGSGETILAVAVLAQGVTPVAGNTPPSFGQVSVSPTQVDFTGGPVQLSAHVTDPDNSPARVVALVSTSGTLTGVPLTLTGTVYTGTFAAPANAGAQNRSYQVYFTATDAPNGSNQSITSPEQPSFTVRALATPPDMPGLS